MTVQAGDPFGHSTYSIQGSYNKFACLARCEVVDQLGQRILRVNMAEGLRQRIRAYSGRSRKTLALMVNNPKAYGPVSQLGDYPVLEPDGESMIGFVRLHKDFFLLDQVRQPVGLFKRVPELEDGLRQQVWDVTVDGVQVCHVVCWAPGSKDYKYMLIDVECSKEIPKKLDRRLILSGVLFLTHSYYPPM